MSDSSGVDVPPTSYTAWRKSISSSVSALRSSHRTPEASSIDWRSPGCTTGDAAAASSTTRGEVGPSSPRMIESSETPSSVTIEYSVPTDGFVWPLSSWEMRLGDRPRLLASLRWLRPARSRSSRRRSPIASSASGTSGWRRPCHINIQPPSMWRFSPFIAGFSSRNTVAPTTSAIVASLFVGVRAMVASRAAWFPSQ